MSAWESSGTLSKRQRRRQYWWDVGIVTARKNEVVVDLMGKPNHNPSWKNIRRATCKVTAEKSTYFNGKFPGGMGFAVVGTKLYAFGGCPGYRIINQDPYEDVFEYPRNLFVCDLPADPENHESLQCVEHSNKLLGPKQDCIHVAYREEKLIMLATYYVPIGGYGSDDREYQCPAPCEVLDLKDLTVQTVHAPFWDSDESYPEFQGYVVVGSSLYVDMYDPSGQRRLYCLDMAMENDKLQWLLVDDDENNGACSAAVSPMLYRYREKWSVNNKTPPCSSVVRKGRLFLMKLVDRRLGFFVKKVEEEEGEEEEELPELSNVLANVEKGFFFGGITVVPYGNDDDDDDGSGLFCLFLWLKGQACKDWVHVCKFKLLDDNGGGCEVLAGWPSCFENEVYGSCFTAFTPDSYTVMEARPILTY